MCGIFGNLFDFNKDGHLDSTEKAMEFMMIKDIMDKSKKDDGITMDEIIDFDLMDD